MSEGHREEGRAARLGRAPGALLGRERELAVCEALLLREDVGLLTLTGMGGIGKTRLAAHLAQRVAGAFPDGARLVSLASVTDAELVPQAVAVALGVHAERAAEAVFAALRGARMLLVLDNLEHVLDAAGFVAELLIEAPGVRVLATSRAPLQLSGEYEFPLGPLALPPAPEHRSAQELLAVPSVALFVRRAAELNPQLDWTAEALSVVADIVTRLGGWPLSLELAAARTRLLSLPALRDALEEPLRVLTRGARDLPERQQTLRATLDWSSALLGAREAALLARLAVFHGPFTAQDVEGAFGDAGHLDVLTALVEHGWVRGPSEDDGGLALLEPVREYAQEKLTALGALPEAQEAHARHYLAGLEAVFAAGSPRADRGAYLRWVTARYPQLRSALAWAVNGGHTALALRLERGLYQYWMSGSGTLDEGRIWSETLLLRAPDADAETRAHLYNVTGHLALLQGEVGTAERHHEEALRLARQVGRPVLEANTLLLLAQAARFDPDGLARAERLVRDALARYTDLQDAPGRQGSTMSLVAILAAQRRDAEALALTEALLPDARDARNPLIQVQVLVWIASLRVRSGRLQEAQAPLEEARALAERIPSPSVRLAVHRADGEWELASGRVEDAAVHFSRALEEARAARVPGELAMVTEALARVAEAQGRRDAAIDLYGQVDRAFATPQLHEAARGALARLTGEGAGTARPAVGLTDLTARETEVLAWVARGHTNARIAAELGISLPTVNAHLRTVFSKLGVGSRVLAARIAHERGLTD